MINMSCNICNSEVNQIFEAKILNKYDIKYFKCCKCGFIQTEKPYWLNESYSSAIATTDIGLVSRNISFQEITSFIIKSFFDRKAKFLDYAGGYGLFVRLMRDKGFEFYRQDIYCDNLFSQYFDVTDLSKNMKFELLTAFEVFEHLENPLEQIEQMFQYSDTILFSTELQPQKTFNSADDWWYFTTETGQHISLYTLQSLEILGSSLNCKLYSNNRNLHILTKRELDSNPFVEYRNLNKKILPVRVLNKMARIIETIFDKSFKKSTSNSLLIKDYNYIKNKINKTN